MAVAGIVGIRHLLPEFLANALIILGPLQPAWAVTASALQAFPYGFHHFLVFIESNCHGHLSFRMVLLYVKSSSCQDSQNKAFSS